jgi:hypothetical protein
MRATAPQDSRPGLADEGAHPRARMEVQPNVRQLPQHLGGLVKPIRELQQHDTQVASLAERVQGAAESDFILRACGAFVGTALPQLGGEAKVRVLARTHASTNNFLSRHDFRAVVGGASLRRQGIAGGDAQRRPTYQLEQTRHSI